MGRPTVVSSAAYLYLDFETISAKDSLKAGLDNYSRNCEVLMLGWALSESDVRLWVPAEGEPMPADLELYLRSPGIVKVAWNAPFERLVTKHALGIDTPVRQWLDVAVLARYAALPSALAGTCAVLGLPVDESKDKQGKALIRTFCIRGRKGHKTPAEAPDLWETFKAYCKRDVVAERAVLRKLAGGFSLPPRERRIWELDQKINERGIPVDLDFVRHAAVLTSSERERLMKDLKALTGLENPNSRNQMLAWVRERGYPYQNLAADTIRAALKEVGQ